MVPNHNFQVMAYTSFSWENGILVQEARLFSSHDDCMRKLVQMIAVRQVREKHVGNMLLISSVFEGFSKRLSSTE